MKQSSKWYSNVEPEFQIKLLKEIAFKEQSQTTLKNKFDVLPSSIDISISKLKSKYGLIQVIKEKQITVGKRPQKLLSLTKKGIFAMVENHYQKTGKPYINAEEFGRFLFNLFGKYSAYQNTKDNIKEWMNPNLSKKDITDAYQKANPNILIDKFKD